MVGRGTGLHSKEGGQPPKGHKNKKQSVELQALRFLRGSTRDSVTPAVYQFLSSLGIAATDAATAYTLLVGVYEKAQRDYTLVARVNKSGVVCIRSIRRNLCGSSRSPSRG